MYKTIVKLLAALAVLFIQGNIIAQDAIKIKKLSSPVEFDGLPFENAWKDLDFFPMTMFKPDFGVTPKEVSEVMIAHDDKYIWIGARLYMNDANQIAITSKKRDDLPRSPDYFSVLFDSYNDNENGSVFFVNPSGARTDYTVSNDGTGASNFSWNTFWDVKTTKDDKGWYVEMRIPFSSLRFSPKDNIATMGLVIRRSYKSNNEIDTYPAVDPKYGVNAANKPSLASTIYFEDAQPSNPIYISPYIIGGKTRNWALNTGRTEYEKTDKYEANAGLDIKYNLNSNLTLDMTINTDFAQVEADDQQVNLTRYSLSFPEKRMFFQERSSLFNFSLGGSSNLFYSRNIGISNGESIRLLGGARLVGRMGKWDVGILNTQTEKHEATPGENFGVFRMRRQVINPYSYLGGMFTSRLGMDGSQNYAYGVDGIIRLFKDDYLDMKVAQTYDNKTDNKIASVTPMFISAKWDNRSVKGFSYDFEYSYSGEEFNPGVGFVRMPGIQGFSGDLLYGWLPGTQSKIYSSKVFLNFSRYNRIDDGKKESFSLSPDWQVSTKKGYGFDLSVTYKEEGVKRNFSISNGMVVNAGDYSFTEAALVLSSPTSKPFNVGLKITAGGFYNGEKYSLTVAPAFDVSSSLQLSGTYQFNNISLPGVEKRANIHVASAKILYMLNTKFSASLGIQYASTTDNLISNFRFRYNPREGNDFYLVFNDYRSVSNEIFTPALPDYYNQTILLKYTHTFKL